MADHTPPVGLSLELPALRPVASGGGAWPLVLDRCEHWAWSRDAFLPHELDAVQRIGAAVELDRAHTYGGDDPRVRDSFVQFLYPNEVTDWLFARIADIVMALNGAFFGFELTGMEQGLQYTQYSAPGEHYDWHIDRSMGTGIRKLSLSLQLSDPETYTGGDLELWFGGEPIKAPRERGVITLFPSWVMHRVTPVTAGVRRSLVCWVSGPPFR